MKYRLDVHLDLSVDEIYELQLALASKMKNEEAARMFTEQKRDEWVGKGSIAIDNVLLCELASIEIRIKALRDLYDQIQIAFDSAAAAEARPIRRARKLAAEDAENAR